METSWQYIKNVTNVSTGSRITQLSVTKSVIGEIFNVYFAWVMYQYQV
jgi:hypothetical protein